ncbi:LapA family protein [Paenibacillus sp. HN-1]|uniref:LapA family protein n=1 Tax=Paenibacillus TaxID=44249 RepID=UPI001CA8B0CE|nr:MULTISPECIES: LapA family protein [Paenibacillus]MBY9082496.1 LapA family protein [Paenibacillus sp. CGMCC 1.18879]MBY9084855.1 LapA family protein [Paenibacillus sinensis]
MRNQWSIILGLLFALLVALFAVINVDPVQVNFGFSLISIPLILVILGCALIGAIIAGFYGIFRGYKQQRRIKALTAELTEAQGRLAVLETAQPVPSEMPSADGFATDPKTTYN